MATKTTKQKPMSTTNYFIVLLLVTLLVLGVSVLIGKTLVETVITDTKVVIAKNKANTQLKANLEAAPQLVSNYEGLATTKALIANSLPNTADLPGLIALLENMSGAAGVSLKSVSPSQAVGTTTATVAPVTTDVASPQPYNVSLTFDANYPALQSLLNSMEKSARPMRVTAMQLTGTGSNLSVQLELTTYYMDKAKLPFKMEVVK